MRAGKHTELKKKKKKLKTRLLYRYESLFWLPLVTSMTKYVMPNQWKSSVV